MQLIKFREWEFLVDKQSTLETYSKVTVGGPDSCGCSYCKNFVANRDELYPDEIRLLFSDLGIDWNKEYEVVEYGIIDPDGNYLYGGWFHFKGQLVKKSTKIPFEKTDDTPISVKFSIRFRNCKGGGNSYFENKDDDLVQIDFEVKIPWVLSQD
jgi:hypothetical protein